MKKKEKLEMLIKALKLIKKHYNCTDPEVGHARADECLLTYISNKEVNKAFDDIKKHYA